MASSASAGVLTLDTLRAGFEAMKKSAGTHNRPQVLLWSMAQRDVAGRAGRTEIARILSDMAAATRPVFGDIITGMVPEPSIGHAANWFVGAGPWPYPPPEPQPPVGPTFADIERSAEPDFNFWKTQV